MDPMLVADQIVHLARTNNEGLFLLARVVTSQLRTDPVDTTSPGWEAELATSVEAALAHDLSRIIEPSPSGTPGPLAAGELLTALAWGYGTGVPDDVWAAFATGLSKAGSTYSVADVYWVLAGAARYVVAANGGGRAVYRLSHQRLAQQMRPARRLIEQLEQDLEAVAVATAVRTLFDEVGAAGEDPAAHRYLWLHSWRHYVDAGLPGIQHLRAISRSNPAFLPDLAMALNILGARYSEVGRRQDAVAPTEEAVTLYRNLAADNPTFPPDLAKALNNLGIRYSGVGRRQNAVAPTEEAVTLYQGLSADNPAFLPNLATALNNLGAIYGQVGRRQEAAAPTEEAVTLNRGLAAGNPAILPELAGALSNLGIRYSQVGRRQEAVAPTEEAVTLRRDLAAGNPAFLPDLAMGLNNLGARYSQVGRRIDAVAPAEEAVTLYQDLAAQNPAFLPDLAMGLNNLGAFYSEVGRHQEAVAATEEAVTLYQDLSADNPAFLPDLAGALNNLGASYSQVGRHQEAVAPTEKAVTRYRDLAADDSAFLPDLAMALNNLGIRYSQRGRRQEAVAPTEEAVTRYRDLAAANPAFLPDLATALNNLGIRYGEVGREDETDQAWESTLTVLADGASCVELLLSRASAREVASEAIADLGRAYDLLPAGELILTGRLHQAARSCRSEAPDIFDSAWLARLGEVPDWLTLDSALLGRVIEWMETPTYAAAFAVTREHEQVFLRGATDLALTELALFLGEPEAVEQQRTILKLARENGFDVAYAPYLRREEMLGYLESDSATQADLLRSRRASLLDVGSEELANIVATDRLTHLAGVALLGLARQDLDQEALQAVSSPEHLADMARQLVSVGDGQALLALSQLLASVAVDLAQVAAAFFHAAIGQVLAEETESGIEFLREARRTDDGTVKSLFATLLTWTGLRPELAVLAPVLAESLPAENGEQT